MSLKNNNIEKFPFTYWLNGAISNIKKKIVSKNVGGGGGGGVKKNIFFLEKNSFSFHVLCYFQH